MSLSGIPFALKSMNGIISISDGAGVVISDGTITAPTIDLTFLNIDQIQGTTPSSNTLLYTTTTGDIRMGDNAALTTVQGVTLDLKGTDVLLESNNDTSLIVGNNCYVDVAAGGFNLISNALIVGGGQDIRQANTANDFYIGSNVTTRNFFLGNLTAPPQIPFSATTGFDAVNYDTMMLAIGGGGSGTIAVDYVTSFDVNNFESIWADNLAGIQVGSALLTNTAQQSIGSNNGSVSVGMCASRSANTFIASPLTHSGNVYIASGLGSSGNVYIAANNFGGPPSGTFSTTDVFIGGSSTSNRYNGDINIAAFNAGGTNSVNIGSAITALDLKGSGVEICNAASYAGTINIANGSAFTGNLNISNGGTSASTIAIQSGATTSVSNNTISIGNNKTTLNLCNTVGSSGTQAVNIGQASSTNTILGVTNINTTGLADTAIGGAGGDVSITSAAGVTLNGGIKLGGSNFTSPIRVAFGRQTTTPGTGSPGLSATQSITFGVTFGANPFVFLQIIKNTYTGGAGQMCIGLESVSTTTCSFSVRNNSNTGAPANSYYVNWFAIGQY